MHLHVCSHTCKHSYTHTCTPQTQTRKWNKERGEKVREKVLVLVSKLLSYGTEDIEQFMAADCSRHC